MTKYLQENKDKVKTQIKDKSIITTGATVGGVSGAVSGGAVGAGIGAVILGPPGAAVGFLIGFNAYQSTDLRAINSHLCLSMFSHNLLTHAFINELRAKGKSLTKKNISNLSILNMQNIIRFESNLNTFDYCIEQSDIISKNKTKKEIKKYLVAAWLGGQLELIII